MKMLPAVAGFAMRRRGGPTVEPPRGGGGSCFSPPAVTRPSGFRSAARRGQGCNPARPANLPAATTLVVVPARDGIGRPTGLVHTAVVHTPVVDPHVVAAGHPHQQ